MNKRAFECVDDTHSKFWTIEVNDMDSQIELITHYGRIGTVGQITTKTYYDFESMDKEYKTMVKSKLKKGYIETTI